jgi:hypothetical protein
MASAWGAVGGRSGCSDAAGSGFDLAGAAVRFMVAGWGLAAGSGMGGCGVGLGAVTVCAGATAIGVDTVAGEASCGDMLAATGNGGCSAAGINVSAGQAAGSVTIGKTMGCNNKADGLLTRFGLAVACHNGLSAGNNVCETGLVVSSWVGKGNGWFHMAGQGQTWLKRGKNTLQKHKLPKSKH